MQRRTRPGMTLVLRWRTVLRACPNNRLLYARDLHLSTSRHAAQYSTAISDGVIQRTRNIGIIAHIDAGKTTTTERMLYYSGFTRRLGDVDEGSTVTDFLPAERARGITIQSAAISFHWPPSGTIIPSRDPLSTTYGSLPLPRSLTPHNINLIDTPGHADFTFEVIRSLRVLDGAVCILDGVAGVEAQTEHVWQQANEYQISRIIFVNKLDRDGAAFHRTVKEIAVRLHSCPAVCQIPWWKCGTGKLVGLGDAVRLSGMLWEEGSDGKAIKVHSLNELEAICPLLASELRKARIALVELLSEHDDHMVEQFIDHVEDHLAIPSLAIIESLRRCTLRRPQRVIPLFAGASFRNIGVQPLLDAIVDMLPSPDECPQAEARLGSMTVGLNDLFGGKITLASSEHDATKGSKNAITKTTALRTSLISNLQACALAFKVVNDSKRGLLVYVRVYRGTLAWNTVVFNTNLALSERATRLLKVYANDAVDVEEISTGQIGVIPGLKHTRTGDTLVVYAGANPKGGPPEPINSIQLQPIAVPPPVFFTSVQPDSLSEEKRLTEMLAILLREDPSLSVTLDPESGQTHLSGMGELHLEIAGDRLLNDFKVRASIGAIEIGYREAVTTSSNTCTEYCSREIGGKLTQAGCTASVSPLSDDDGDALSKDKQYTTILPLDPHNRLVICHPTIDTTGRSVSAEAPGLPDTLPFATLLTAFSTGAAAALARGPSHRAPLHNTTVTITLDPAMHTPPNTSPAALSGAARLAVASALRCAGGADGNALMEPVMRVSISVPDRDLGAVVHDISSARGGHVVSLDDDDDDDASLGQSASSSRDIPIIDPRRIYAPPDPFGNGGAGDDDDGDDGVAAAARERRRQISARVPLKEMLGYLRHLRSLTKGRGTFVMTVDRFERVTGPRLRAARERHRAVPPRRVTSQ